MVKYRFIKYNNSNIIYLIGGVTIDKGAKFAKEQLLKEIRLSRERKISPHLHDMIEREYNRIKHIDKTGDMIDHFARYENDSDEYKKDFAKFKKFGVIPDQEIAAELRKRFPEEIENKTTISDFKSGCYYSNDEISRIFRVSGRGGGIRPSNTTKTIVLILKHDGDLYDDKWLGDTLNYTGAGQIGDQELTRNNKSLLEANDKGYSIHLFESYEKGKYLYQGEVALIDKPKREQQIDIKGNLRWVYVFPLKLKERNEPVPVDENVIKDAEAKKANKTKKILDNELEEKAKKGQLKPGSRRTLSVRIDRDPFVAEYAKRRAKGTCDLCEQPAPFKSKNGRPYLESHHIIHLSDGGVDTIYNTVALCPNCHKKIHILENQEDISFLINKVKKYLKGKKDQKLLDKMNRYFN